MQDVQTDTRMDVRTNQRASRDEHTRAIEHHSRTTRSEQSDSKIFRFYCTVSRLVAACSISIEERFLWPLFRLSQRIR